jgi:hypothetical protein
MNINDLTTDEAITAITAMKTIEELRDVARVIGIKYSGNSGESVIRANLISALKSQETKLPDFGGEDFDETQIQTAPARPKKGPSASEILNMDPNTISDPQLLRQVVRGKSLRLHRVRITNLDPSDAQLDGAIITVINKYTGKVSKYVPYGDDDAPNGYHIPEILLNHLKNQKFPLRREIKGGAFGVKKYKTSMINKFAIEHLPMLTQKELNELASHQKAANAIDT